MIGKIDFSEGGKPRVLTLGDDGNVACDDPSVLRWAQAEKRVHDLDYSPANGAYGVALLRQLGRALQGRVTLEPKQKEPAGTVY